MTTKQRLVDDHRHTQGLRAFQPIGLEIATGGPAEGLSEKMAHWARMLDEVVPWAWEGPLHTLPRGCLFRDVCSRARTCALAYTRALAIARARDALRAMREEVPIQTRTL